MAHAREILKTFEKELEGDDHLFWVLDLDLGDEGRPHLVTGAQALGFCYNVTRGGANYDIRYAEPNSGSAAAKRAIAIKEIRDESALHFGSYEQPLTIAEELAQAKAKIAEYEKEKQASQTASDKKETKEEKKLKEEALSKELAADKSQDGDDGKDVKSKTEKGGDK